MKITFIGAAHEVTGSCTLLSAAGKNILVDCGMEQGADTFENAPIPVSPLLIDAVFLTHAHIDHSGLIPSLVKKGYKGPIYLTEATGRLAKIMLMDSAHIQEQEASWRNRKAKRSGTEGYEPLYDTLIAEKTAELFNPYPYNKKVDIAEGIKAEFTDAGHLLGSSSIHFEITENGKTKTLLFSGDIGNIDRPLIKNPQKPPYADFVVIESTYGDRVHGERPDYETQLLKILKDTFDRGGNLLIPSFAIGRTQELLYLFGKIKAENLLPGYKDFPVFVDSPLAAEATNIYKDDFFGYYDEETLALFEKGINPVGFPGLNLSVTKEESVAINFDKTPKVIISSSGMCEAGRIRHHLKHNLWREDSTVLFVGYQSEGSLGRRLLNGETTVNLFGERIEVKAKIEALAGISGHADRDMLLSWLSSMEMEPKMVFVNHGDEKVCESFALLIEKNLKIRAEAPFSGDEFDLHKEIFTKREKAVRAVLKKKEKVNSAFDNLILAGQRLCEIIKGCKGLTNRELSDFAGKINALSEKYAGKKKNKKF